MSSEDGQVFYCMMFEYLTGTMPDEEGSGLPYQFEKLGEITARLHEHVRNWEQSQSLKRFRWDYDAMLGKNPEWGRQDGLGVTGKRKELFQKVAGIIKERLDRFGQSPDRFGLIHADLRLTNLLVEKNELKVIDFDDCGYSWFLYDLAASLTFIEHKDYAQP
ncbi:phosphotransferase [Terrilactibacillus sp. S3-3]|nr:phosphotransferase [Terrilactibacillus sp. S3-3]